MSREEEMEISCSTKVARRGRGAITPSTLESSRDARTAVNHRGDSSKSEIPAFFSLFRLWRCHLASKTERSVLLPRTRPHDS